MFVHRNTLVYRLEKIKKLTGLDLREFDDAITFKVALMVKKYLTPGASTPEPRWITEAPAGIPAGFSYPAETGRPGRKTESEDFKKGGCIAAENQI